MESAQKNRKITIISLLTIAVGTTVMLGWVFNILALQTIAPGFGAMRFNAGLCFVLFGCALLSTQYQTKYQRAIYMATGLLGAVIGLVTISQDLLHYNSGLDQLFIADKTGPSASIPFPGRMAFNASLNFSLLGLGLLGITIKKRYFKITSQFFFHIVALLSAISLVGYLYGISLFTVLLYKTSMAGHTAILFFISAGAASLLNPRVGLIRLFTGQRMGNRMARRLFVLIILIVISFGALRLQTERYQLFSSIDIGISLLAIGFLLVSFVLIWDTANWLNKIDAQRSEAEGKVKQMNLELEKRVEERSSELLSLLVQFQKSEEKYHSLIEQASDAIYVIDLDDNFTDVNASMCNMLGYTRQELLQLKVEAIVDPEELKTDPLRKVIENPDKPFIRERRFINKNGQILTVEINVKLFSDDRVMVIARDITNRKEMETELRDAELRFRTIADKSMVGVYIVQHGKFSYVNPRFAEVFGYEPNELTNTIPIEEVFHESYQAIATENVRRRINGEVDSIHYEALGRKKDGTGTWVEFYGSRAIMSGRPTIIGSMIDINERKKAGELILREKTLSDKIINSLPGIFYLYNDKYKFLRWNKNFEVLTGYSTAEIERLNAAEIIAPEDHEVIEQAMQMALTDGYASVEAKAITKVGVKVPFLFTGTPILYEDQRCLLGTGIDISSRINAEEELRWSEQKYKLLFESNPLPLWMIAKDNMTVIACNEAAADLYGYTKEELQNAKATMFRPEEDRELQLEGYRQDIDDSQGLRIVRHLKKDGTKMFVQLISHDIIFEGRPVRLSLTNDVTEKLKAEESLQKSEANLQTILNTTDTVYALFDMELKVQAFNTKAVQFIKEQYHHLPGKGDRLEDYFPHDRFPDFLSLAQKVLNGNNINYEIDYPQTDGSVTWYHVRLFPITSDNKKIMGMMMALYDITERKNAEQDLKSAYGRIQSHIDSIKDMAWKQSHLIRSPLANLKGLIEMLQDDPEDIEAYSHMLTELDRMDAIIIEMAEEASYHDVE